MTTEPRQSLLPIWDGKTDEEILCAVENLRKQRLDAKDERLRKKLERDMITERARQQRGKPKVSDETLALLLEHLEEQGK